MRIAPLVVFVAFASIVTLPAIAAADEPIAPLVHRPLVDFTIFGGYVPMGASGGDYEASCGTSANCYARSRMHGATFGARVGHELGEGLGVELELGRVFMPYSVSRTTMLAGEQSNFVPVDVHDDVSASATTVVAFARFTKRVGPIELVPAVGIGAAFLKVDDARTGTITVDDMPGTYTQRRLVSNPNLPTSQSPLAFLFVPELRVAVRPTEMFSFGVSLGAEIMLGAEARPSIIQAADQTDVGHTAKYNGRAIGFVPQPNTIHESATHSIAVLRTTAFATLTI